MPRSPRWTRCGLLRVRFNGLLPLSLIVSERARLATRRTGHQAAPRVTRFRAARGGAVSCRPAARTRVLEAQPAYARAGHDDRLHVRRVVERIGVVGRRLRDRAGGLRRTGVHEDVVALGEASGVAVARLDDG